MNSKANKNFDVWKVVSALILALYALFLIYPLWKLLYNAFFSNGVFTLEQFQKFFSQSYYIKSIFNSIKVSLLATILTLIIGIPLAYFYQMYEVKGQAALQVIIILCSMSAPFIGAYSWIMLLGRSGVLTKFIESILPIRMPSIYGFNGILLVLALQLFPLVFLYVSGALKNVDNSLLEASENLGCSGVERFFKIVIPLCMPTIIAATLMVFMRAFADFGTPLLIGEGYQTFPVVIYNSYFAETGGDHNFGAAISVIAIIITAIIFLLQRYVNGKFKFTMNALHPIERKQLSGLKAFLVNFYCWFIVLLAFMPQVYVMYTSFLKTSGKIFLPGYSLDSYKFAFTHLRNAIPNTFLIGGLALIIVILLAILIAYLVVRRNNAVNRVIDTLSMIPYVIPGSVVGDTAADPDVDRRGSHLSWLFQAEGFLHDHGSDDGKRHPVGCDHVLGHDHHRAFNGDHPLQPEDDYPDAGNLYICIARQLRYRSCLCDDPDGRDGALAVHLHEGHRKQGNLVLKQRSIESIDLFLFYSL